MKIRRALDTLSLARAWNGAIKKQRRYLSVTILTATLTLVAAAQTPSFQGLGQMPGATFAGGTYSSGISGDGSTIMGYGWVCAAGQSKCNSSDTVLAYRWTVAGKYQILGSRGNSDFLDRKSVV